MPIGVVNRYVRTTLIPLGKVSVYWVTVDLTKGEVADQVGRTSVAGDRLRGETRLGRHYQLKYTGVLIR